MNKSSVLFLLSLSSIISASCFAASTINNISFAAIEPGVYRDASNDYSLLQSIVQDNKTGDIYLSDAVNTNAPSATPTIYLATQNSRDFEWVNNWGVDADFIKFCTQNPTYPTYCGPNYYDNSGNFLLQLGDQCKEAQSLKVLNSTSYLLGEEMQTCNRNGKQILNFSMRRAPTVFIKN